MNGKNKCRILKDIRQQIARNNDIAYATSECKHQGDCSGICPKCEAELRYLEEELKKRQKAGKAIAVAGIAAAVMVSASGCLWDTPLEEEPLAGDVPYYEQTETVPDREEDIAGAIAADETEPEETEPEETVEVLMGDIAYEE